MSWQTGDKLRDRTGDVYGRITITRLVEYNAQGEAMWEGTCACGATTNPIRGSSLTAGFTRSCGCLARELAAARLLGKSGEKSIAHGHRPNVMRGEKNPAYKHGHYAKKVAA